MSAATKPKKPRKEPKPGAKARIHRPKHDLDTDAGDVTTYRLTMSDGKRVEIEATSCAQAIEDALWANRGLRVVDAYAELTEEDARQVKLRDRDAQPKVGIQDFRDDIPPHEPIADGAVRKKRVRKIDSTMAMFDEEAIKEQSKAALELKEATEGATHS